MTKSGGGGSSEGPSTCGRRTALERNREWTDRRVGREGILWLEERKKVDDDEALGSGSERQQTAANRAERRGDILILDPGL
eukprot:scaffold1659_cov255-Pinguiococcus_pyrenoidosus.AAC.58